MLKPPLILIVALFVGALSASEDIKKVIWATPNWQGYTNADGTGLYNELVFELFKRRGVEVHQIEVPWLRALKMVNLGQADFTGGGYQPKLFRLSKYPLINNTEMVLYRIDSIPNFNSAESLDNKKGVWASGYLRSLPSSVSQYIQGYEVSNRKSALKMLLTPSRKIDFYIDNLEQMRVSIKEFP